jgi:hypothetical protein
MLRYFTLITSILCFNYTFSQISDNFTDGDFTSAPTWTLNSTTDFTVNAGQLKSANTTTPGNFYISTSNTLAANCQWEFWTNLQFATSSTNYVDIYLTSDVSNLQATNINGYFVRLGGTLDEICLYKRSGAIGTAVKIIDGVDAVIASSSSNLIKIKVIRNASNLFSLERDMTGTGSSYVSEGTITDATFTTSNSFGFFIQQSTGSFVGKHLFDDIIVGPIILDTTPPSIVSALSTSSTSVDVFFNENVDLITSQTVSNYTITPSIGTPASATRDAVNFKLVHLTTTPSLVSGITYTIAINNVQDLAGNAISISATSFLYIAFGTPNFKDIVINEIFADPSPVVNLTSCEFIELYNRSASPFNLSGLKFTDNTSLATLGSYTLAPNGYVIICPIADTAQFTALGYMNKLGVSSFASLTNSGKNLYLKTALGAFIDSVNYSDTWYKNAFKKDGGYTLEQINPNINPSCAQINNWIASNDVDGGTPGFINSLYSIAPDVTGPKISGITVIDSTHISICFNDLISVSQLTISSNYSINGSIGSPTLSVAGSGNTCVTLSLATKLINATNYTVTITGITDCASNSLSPNKGLISFYKHKAFDVVINELMPDPDPAINLPTEEYVELKNRTPFKINLKNWTISTPTSTKKYLT